MKRFRLKPFVSPSLSVLLAVALYAQSDESVTKLDAYTLTSIPQTQASALPTDYAASGAYAQADHVMDIPRALTLVPSGQVRDLGIEDYADLSKIGAGTQRPNYLGIAGTPYLRGDDAGLFFSGMRRAYQLLAFPQSFNSTAEHVIVKGPAPAHMGTTQAGGYVNQIAKRPNASEQSMVLEYGSYDHMAASIDTSGTSTWGEHAMEYRFSLHGQDANSYYRNVEDKRRSFYAAMETLLNERTELFTAFELYQWEGNENPGWNRVTQSLIDNGTYQTGEPATATTVQLNPQKVLVAPEDIAKATDFFGYMELRIQSDAERTLTHQVFMEHFDADKRSPSNDYAFSAKAWVVENKLTLEQTFDQTRFPTQLNTGLSLRFNQVDERFAFSGATDSVAIEDINMPVGNTGPSAWNNINHGDYVQTALFASARTQWSDRFETFTGLRIEATRFDTEAVDNVRGQKNYYHAELSPLFRLNDTHSLYASIQQGTALIPGEGGSVTGENNFGETELYEAGIKSQLWDNTLWNTFSIYWWVKSEFNSRAGAAERFRAQGVEWELNYQPSTQFYLLGSLTAQRTWKRGGPPDRLSAFNLAAASKHSFVAGGTPAANNPQNIVPGTPEVQAKLFAVAQNHGFRVGGGPIWSDGFWTSYDRLLRVPSSLIWNGFVSYSRGNWDTRIDVENLTDELYFSGSDPNYFGNALITPEPGRMFKLSISRSF